MSRCLLILFLPDYLIAQEIRLQVAIMVWNMPVPPLRLFLEVLRK